MCLRVAILSTYAVHKGKSSEFIKYQPLWVKRTMLWSWLVVASTFLVFLASMMVSPGGDVRFYQATYLLFDFAQPMGPVLGTGQYGPMIKSFINAFGVFVPTVATKGRTLVITTLYAVFASVVVVVGCYTSLLMYLNTLDQTDAIEWLIRPWGMELGDLTLTLLTFLARCDSTNMSLLALILIWLVVTLKVKKV
ncbi:hypothetical protein KIPB_001393 [Kipferlia bialata]|uniref:Uncharacterized protein n=1 Tax=Kipferlia bialata TaxID=797122 RepID=A0A9K3CNN5_9EUKA|nr:hypothetical protein KIPB_001393 [Kipferlia bialata]|eukprot:g1393.t1